MAIAGLYAAGEIIGVYYRNYSGSTSALKGMVFGKSADAEVLRDNSVARRAMSEKSTANKTLWNVEERDKSQC
jgi:aspartate oxidase